MAAHRYWRATSIEAYGSVGLDITEFQLLAGVTRVDVSASLTSNIAPSSGSLANLKDDNTATGAIWSAQDLGTLALVWDFGGIPQDVTDIRLGAAVAQAKFALIVRIDYSDDAATWTTYTTFSGISWPGPRAKTASVFRYLDISSPEIVSYADMEGANGATSVSDKAGKGKTWALWAGASLSTAQKKTGSSSLYLNGTSAYAEITNHADFNFDAGDWTIEFMAYLNGSPSDPAVGTFVDRWTTYGVFMSYSATTRLSTFGATNSTSGTKSASSSNPIPLATWCHIALVRSGTNLLTFINGNLEATATGFVGAIDAISDHLSIGRDSAGTRYINAYLDEWRVTKGRAQYTASFDPNFSFIQVNAVRGRTGAQSPDGAIQSALQMWPFAGAALIVPPTRARGDYLTGVIGKGIGRVKGTTKDKGSPNVPVSERVRLYREQDGLLIREMWSASGTGAYSFDYVDEYQTYTVISYDHDKNFRAVVADGLTLANGGVELIA